ncbi:MAG: putative toxin-antitoxin system toxin component, PIN family [Nanoarchaeota archaeon]
MKITTDTNVLISSTFWSGDSDRILEKVENKEIELVLSKEIIEEFSKVLEYKEIKDKIKDKNLEMKRTVEKIISLSTIIVPSLKFNEINEDPSDNIILDCAVEGNVDFILSQDKHLLNLKEFRGIKIINPADFLNLQFVKTE